MLRYPRHSCLLDRISSTRKSAPTWQSAQSKCIPPKTPTGYPLAIGCKIYRAGDPGTRVTRLTTKNRPVHTAQPTRYLQHFSMLLSCGRLTGFVLLHTVRLVLLPVSTLAVLGAVEVVMATRAHLATKE